jgi:hypothetical protein
MPLTQRVPEIKRPLAALTLLIIIKFCGNVENFTPQKKIKNKNHPIKNKGK